MTADRLPGERRRRTRTDGSGGAGDGREGSTEDVDVDVLFDLLGHHRRRLVLRRFVDAGSTEADVDELVEFVRGREAQSGRATPHHQLSIEISLLHVHLPKLESAGVVEFDAHSGTVVYHRSDRLEAVLSAIEDPDV